MAKFTPKSQCLSSGWGGPAWARLFYSLISSLPTVSLLGSSSPKGLTASPRMWQVSIFATAMFCLRTSCPALTGQASLVLQASIQIQLLERPVRQLTQTRRHWMTPYCMSFLLYCFFFFSKALPLCFLVLSLGKTLEAPRPSSLSILLFLQSPFWLAIQGAAAWHPYYLTNNSLFLLVSGKGWKGTTFVPGR